MKASMTLVASCSGLAFVNKDCCNAIRYSKLQIFLSTNLLYIWKMFRLIFEKGYGVIAKQNNEFLLESITKY